MPFPANQLCHRIRDSFPPPRPPLMTIRDSPRSNLGGAVEHVRGIRAEPDTDAGYQLSRLGKVIDRIVERFPSVSHTGQRVSVNRLAPFVRAHRRKRWTYR